MLFRGVSVATKAVSPESHVTMLNVDSAKFPLPGVNKNKSPLKCKTGVIYLFIQTLNHNSIHL